jgi:hypothetical protein
MGFSCEKVISCLQGHADGDECLDGGLGLPNLMEVWMVLFTHDVYFDNLRFCHRLWIFVANVQTVALGSFACAYRLL